MPGKKRTPAAPDWYSCESYSTAAAMDLGDWLLNLEVRGWLHRDPQPQTEAALRSVGPVLRRADEHQMKAMHAADIHRWVSTFTSELWDDPIRALFDACARPALPPGVWVALQTGRVPAGIEPLSVAEMYLFERRLPEDIRAAGASFRPSDSFGRHPQAFGGTLDDAFEKPMVSRFVRINLSLPDDVLLADLAGYLASERHRLASLGGEQPYREAARLKRKAHKLSTLSTVGLLEFLDLDRWQRAEGLSLTTYAVREMAGVVDRAREAELVGRVELTLQQMQLHAWFARLERSMTATPKRSAT